MYRYTFSFTLKLTTTLLSKTSKIFLHTYVCASGDKKCSFFGKFGVFCFLVTSVLRFFLLHFYQRLDVVMFPLLLALKKFYKIDWLRLTIYSQSNCALLAVESLFATENFKNYCTAGIQSNCTRLVFLYYKLFDRSLLI